MTETVTLDLPQSVVESARTLAQRTDRRIEEVLAEWLDRYVTERPIEMLSDDEVLALADSQMTDTDQDELSDLLYANRENLLTPEQRPRLDELMTTYRLGMVRKAQALYVAVARGLRKPLDE